MGLGEYDDKFLKPVKLIRLFRILIGSFLILDRTQWRKGSLFILRGRDLPETCLKRSCGSDYAKESDNVEDFCSRNFGERSEKLDGRNGRVSDERVERERSERQSVWSYVDESENENENENEDIENSVSVYDDDDETDDGKKSCFDYYCYYSSY